MITQAALGVLPRTNVLHGMTADYSSRRRGGSRCPLRRSVSLLPAPHSPQGEGVVRPAISVDLFEFLALERLGQQLHQRVDAMLGTSLFGQFAQCQLHPATGA